MLVQICIITYTYYYTKFHTTSWRCNRYIVQAENIKIHHYYIYLKEKSFRFICPSSIETLYYQLNKKDFSSIKTV